MQSRYYPLDPHPNRDYLHDPSFTDFNNTSYYGDSLAKYNHRVTNLSNEDLLVNLSLYNPVTSQVPIDAYFSDNRQAALIPQRPDRYKLCVHGVYLPSSSIYLFEWVNQVTVSQTPLVQYNKYTVTVDYYDGAVQQPTQTVALNFVPYIESDVGSSLQRVFNISQVITSINTAYATAFTNLGIGGIKPPNFVYDAASGIITIYIDEQMNPAAGPNSTNPNPTTWTTAGGQVSIKLGYNFWVNKWFLSTIPSVVYGTNIDGNGSAYISFFNTGNPNVFVTINAVKYYQVVQSNPSTDLLSTVERIVVTSSLQIRPQYVTLLSTTSISGVSNTSNTQSLSILTEFPYTLQTSTAEVSPISYIPSTHNWQDIFAGDTSLSLLTYRILVLRTTGVISNVTLLPGEVCNVKLTFRLK